jgi:hypothetical protein
MTTRGAGAGKFVRGKSINANFGLKFAHQKAWVKKLSIKPELLPRFGGQ